jgi:hypothetical protein
MCVLFYFIDIIYRCIGSDDVADRWGISESRYSRCVLGLDAGKRVNCHAVLFNLAPGVFQAHVQDQLSLNIKYLEKIPEPAYNWGTMKPHE